MKKIIIALSFIFFILILVIIFLWYTREKSFDFGLLESTQDVSEKLYEKETDAGLTPTKDNNFNPKIVRPDLESKFKSYTDSRYNLSFQYPNNFIIVPEERCGEVLSDQQKEYNCLTALKVFPEGVNLNYIPPARFWLIKGVDSVGIGDQISQIVYDRDLNSWIDYVGDRNERLSIYTYTTDGKSIIKAENGGSHSSSVYYIISDYDKDLVAIFSFPQAFRVRCDVVENPKERADCESYLNSIIETYGKKDEDMQAVYQEGWIPEEYFQKLYFEAENIVKTLVF